MLLGGRSCRRVSVPWKSAIGDNDDVIVVVGVDNCSLMAVGLYGPPLITAVAAPLRLSATLFSAWSKPALRATRVLEGFFYLFRN
ncbi:hypothetical protein TSUD_121540 [Trifolium subterraneum]|nr:hypothetical protein TSUD_121540 [Trifolium subterraneum]